MSEHALHIYAPKPLTRLAHIDTCRIVRETFVHAADGSAYTVPGIGSMLRRYCKNAGVESFGLTHLRPKAITDVYQDTGDIRKVMALSGHKTERQALAYVRQFVPIVAQPNERATISAREAWA